MMIPLWVIATITIVLSGCAPTKVVVKNCIDLGAEDMKQCELIKKL